VSNPDFTGPYWQDPAPVGSAGARRARAAADPYMRPVPNGRPAGYEGQAGSGRGGSARDGGNGGQSRAPAGADRQWYGNSAANDYRQPPAQAGRPSPRDGRGRGSRGRGTRGRDMRPVQDPPDAVQDPRGNAGQRNGGDPRYSQVPRGADGRVAQDLRDRLGVRTGPPPRAPQDPRARRGARLAAVDSAAVIDAPGYPGTLQRDRTGAPNGYRPQDTRRGPDRRGGGRGGDGGGYGGGGYGGGPGNRGRGFKEWLLHGSWWRHWSWKKAIAVVVAAFAAMLLLAVGVSLYAYGKTKIPTEKSEAALQQSSNVYFGNGKALVGTFSAGTNRHVLTSAQIPTVIKQAVIAAEDRHFYTEGGISPSGILRAAYEDVSGGTFQGGSTITEELVKNYYATIGSGRTASVKIKEILVSIKLSHEESKDWILTNYLNTVPFGDESYGVAAAAQTYFNEPANSLTVAQAAMLAAMVNEPSFFNPTPHTPGYGPLVQRWHYVLTNMARDGAISQQRARAQAFPKLVRGLVNNGWTGFRGYIMEAVQNELENLYGISQQKMDTGGLKIVTTFNESMMKSLQRSVTKNEQQMKVDGTPLPKYAHIGALLEKPGTGAILAMYGGPSFSAKHCVRLKCQYNMAMQSRNQVGSSFKPYVLATAVHEGMNVQNSVLDGVEPMCVPPDSLALTMSSQTTSCPPDWFPVNIAGENMGPVTVSKAAALSSDPAFEDLIHRAGTQKTIDMAKQFGVDTVASGLQAKAGEVGIALGTASLTVEEQATFFATLAADGMYATPHVIASLSQGNTVIPLRIVHREVLRPDQAADVDYALSFDTTYGTAFPNGVLNPFRPTIGKTGTTDQAQSAFFVGAIPQYSLAVGMFTNSQNEVVGGQTLNGLASVNGQGGGFGGNWPTTIWRTYMDSQFSSLPVKQLPTPNFTGFTKWIQVKVKHKHKHKQSPVPGPTCGPRGRGHGFGGPCPSPTPSPPCALNPLAACPTPTPNPPPTPNPTPDPSPSCLGGCPPSPSPPSPSGQQHAAVAAQAANDPPVMLVRQPVPVGG